MAKRSSGGGKTAKPNGAGPKEAKAPSKRAMVKASNAAGVPLRSGASTDRSFSIRKIANGHIVRESFSHPKKGYVERETYVAGKPRVTVTGTGTGKPTRAF